MKNFSQYGIFVVAIHTLVVALHALSHERLLISLSLFQKLFVGVVIILVPIVAVSFLWTRFFQTGAILLFVSMAGALAFGLYYHFLFISPDHVSQIPMTRWGSLFLITAGLLTLVEGLGAGIGLWIFKNVSHREPVS